MRRGNESGTQIGEKRGSQMDMLSSIIWKAYLQLLTVEQGKLSESSKGEKKSTFSSY